jgi:hypothetical protein
VRNCPGHEVADFNNINIPAQDGRHGSAADALRLGPDKTILLLFRLGGKPGVGPAQ